MKVKITKFFFNYETEERWLNEMSAKGLQLIDYSWPRYLFDEGTPGEFSYRIELLNQLPSHGESRAYIKFMEENGVECVASHLRLFGVIGGVNLFIAMYNLILGLNNGIRDGIFFNAYLSIINWAIVLLFLQLFISYLRKINQLKKEREIFDS